MVTETALSAQGVGRNAYSSTRIPLSQWQSPHAALKDHLKSLGSKLSALWTLLCTLLTAHLLSLRGNRVREDDEEALLEPSDYALLSSLVPIEDEERHDGGTSAMGWEYQSLLPTPPHPIADSHPTSAPSSPYTQASPKRD